jgi:hypothetical protein
MFTLPITQISPYSHSLGDKDVSLSYHAWTSKVKNQQQTQGREEEGTPLTN